MSEYEELLYAWTDYQVDEAFAVIFRIVHEDRGTGNLTKTCELLKWIADPLNFNRMHSDLPLSCLRLTWDLPRAQKDLVEPWNALFRATRARMQERGDDIRALLVGLSEIEG